MAVLHVSFFMIALFGGFLGVLFACIHLVNLKNMIKFKQYPDTREIVLIIALIVFSSFYVYTAHNSQSEMVLDYSVPIYALEDTTRISGSRFYFEEKDKYYFIAGYKDGKKMYSCSVYNTYIVEDDNQQPRIEYWHTISRNPIYKFILGDVPIFEDDGKENKLIVPTDTITNEFNVDLKK